MHGCGRLFESFLCIFPPSYHIVSWMKFPVAKLAFLLVLGCSSAEVLAKLSPEQAVSLPTPADHQVNFSKEIKPIFEASCVKCHGRGKAKGGFQIDSRQTLLKGGESGPAVVPGKSAESFLIELVAGVDPENVMPKKGSKLSALQVGVVRAWIDQGLSWDEGISFSKAPPVNLVPRQPELPAGRKGITNPIDRILQAYFRTNQIVPHPVAADRIFARRVYLDV